MNMSDAYKQKYVCQQGGSRVISVWNYWPKYEHPKCTKFNLFKALELIFRTKQSTIITPISQAKVASAHEPSASKGNPPPAKNSVSLELKQET